MPDLKEWFGTLDRVPAPDLWRRIERRRPAELSLDRSGRRVAVAALALAVGVAGMAVAVRAFVGGGGGRPVITPLPIKPKVNGEIAFFNGLGLGPSDLFVMDSSGGHVRQLTHAHSNLHDADWSPDGQRLALVVGSGDAGGNTHIFVASAEGTDLRQITDGRVLDGDPDWSPDGSRILFERGVYSDRGFDGDYDLYTMRPDGRGLRKLIKLPGEQIQPDWSPDGTLIAFLNRTSRGIFDVYVMRADGTGVRRLTRSPSIESSPQWSPDGSRIAFVRQLDSIVAVDPSGGRESDLFHCVKPCSLLDLSWSPDGSQIVFTVDTTAPRFRRDVYVMNADGSRVRRLTRGIQGCCPAWQPLPSG